MDELAPISERIPNKKHRLFIDELFKCNMNQTRAYMNVYGCEYDAARANASKLLADANISGEVERRLKEAAMSADEVISRLSAQASGDMSDFVTFEDGIKLPFIDLKKAFENGKMPLVKKLKYDKDGHIEFELYDAQAALRLLGQHYGLFTERSVSSNINIDVSTLNDEQLQRIANGDDPLQVIASTPGGG